jgi:hypothetical protein
MKTYRQLALAIALDEVGVKESPAGSNRGPRVDQYQDADDLAGRGYPWCMSFVQWCYRNAGKPLPRRTPSVGFFLDWARKAGWVVTAPRRGDVVCYQFDADSWPDHVGIVSAVLPGGFIRAVEGNTATGNDANGGAVMVRTRRSSRCAFVRVLGRPAATPAKPKPKPAVDELRVDVDVGEIKLRRQRLRNADVLTRLERQLERGEVVTIRKSPGRRP